MRLHKMTTTIMDRATCRINFGNNFCMSEPQYTLFENPEKPLPLFVATNSPVMDIRHFIDTRKMRKHLLRDLGINLRGRRILHILAYHPDADGFINRWNYDVEYICEGEGHRRRWHYIEEHKNIQWCIAYPVGNIIIVVNH